MSEREWVSVCVTMQVAFLLLSLASATPAAAAQKGCNLKGKGQEERKEGEKRGYPAENTEGRQQDLVEGGFCSQAVLNRRQVPVSDSAKHSVCPSLGYLRTLEGTVRNFPDSLNFRLTESVCFLTPHRCRRERA